MSIIKGLSLKPLCSLLVLLLVGSSCAKTIEELASKAEEANTFAKTVAEEVERLNKEINDYKTSVGKLGERPAPDGTTPPADDKDVVEDADKMIPAGVELKKQAYQLMHSINDAKYEAEIVQKSVAEARGKAVGGAALDPKLLQAEKNAQEALETIERDSQPFPDATPENLQEGIDKARADLYAAELRMSKSEAVQRLEKDAAEALHKQEELETKMREYNTNQKPHVEQAMALTPSSEGEKVAELKTRCSDALKQARTLNTMAEEAKGLATAVFDAAGKAETELAAEPDELAKATAAKDKAQSAMGIIDNNLAGAISDIISQAKTGQAKVAEVFVALPITLATAGVTQPPGTETNNKKDEEAKKLEEAEERAKKAEEEKRRLIEQLEEAKKQKEQKPDNPLNLPLDENNKPINIANYMDEKYPGPADGDTDSNCLNRLFDCGKPEMQAQCAGTCARELNNQDHGQNCLALANLCDHSAYADIMSVYCKGTCQ